MLLNVYTRGVTAARYRAHRGHTPFDREIAEAIETWDHIPVAVATDRLWAYVRVVGDPVDSHYLRLPLPRLAVQAIDDLRDGRDGRPMMFSINLTEDDSALLHAWAAGVVAVHAL